MYSFTHSSSHVIVGVDVVRSKELNTSTFTAVSCLTYVCVQVSLQSNEHAISIRDLSVSAAYLILLA